MTNYLIHLKPLTPYFFGGENTFGEANQHYLVRSGLLPQQTTLLGFLRYELLLQNNLLGTDPVVNDWKALIGDKSFQQTENGFTKEFGAIKQLSPVFLSNNKDHFIPDALDWTMAMSDTQAVNSGVKTPSRLSPLEFQKVTDAAGYLNTIKRDVYFAQVNKNKFDPKEGTKSVWTNADGSIKKDWVWQPDVKDIHVGERGFQNGVFIPKPQVGIKRRLQRQKTDTGDFFRQIFYQLEGDFAFCFFAKLELPRGNTFKSRVVTLGGEKSTFAMTVSNTELSFETIFDDRTFRTHKSRTKNAIVLTSDAWTDKDIHSCCEYAITETVPFRNITTLQNKPGDYIRIRGGNLQKNECLLYLLKRGSIFFADNTTDIETALENEGFATIGYNKYIKLAV